jgi:hypothetical protein
MATVRTGRRARVTLVADGAGTMAVRLMEIQYSLHMGIKLCPGIKLCLPNEKNRNLTKDLTFLQDFDNILPK